MKDGLRGLGRGSVTENDRRHILPEGSCDAAHLLGQHPHAEACMACRKAEIHQLACTPFHIFRGGAVVEDHKHVGALKKLGDDFQPYFHLMLLAHQDEHSWIIFINSVEGLVVRECRADQHNVVELAAKRAKKLVHHKPRFAQICQTSNERIERDVARIHVYISIAQILTATPICSSASRR